MEAVAIIDKVKTVGLFLKNIDRLSRLPLLTDPEMDCLFGPDVKAAIAVLDDYNRSKQLCAHCSKRCCLVARCELYAPEFNACPIHEIRPLVCRMHFCQQFQADCKSLIDQVSDIFFDCLLTADREGNPRVKLFDAPPLVLPAPLLVEKTAPLAQAVRDGKLEARKGLELIRREAEKYRTEDSKS